MTTNEDRIVRRAKIREHHDVVFSKLKEKFESRTFPMADLESNVLECKKTESSHRLEGGMPHRTSRFSLYEPHLEFFGIDWSYEFCPECNRVMKRKGVLTNQIDNKAYARKFDVEAKPKQEIEDLVSIFDGGLEVNY